MVVQHGDSIDNNVSLRMNRPLLMKLSTNRSVTSHLTNEPVSFQRFRISTVEYHANVRVYTFKTCRNFFQRKISNVSSTRQTDSWHSFLDHRAHREIAIVDVISLQLQRIESTFRCVFIHFLSLDPLPFASLKRDEICKEKRRNVERRFLFAIDKRE